jgi:hypothetical protein
MLAQSHFGARVRKTKGRLTVMVLLLDWLKVRHVSMHSVRRLLLEIGSGSLLLVGLQLIPIAKDLASA